MAAPTGKTAKLVDGKSSWMLRAAKVEDLIYVVDAGKHEVDVYSYPQRRHVGTLKSPGAPQADCVDGAGNIWIIGVDIVEYPHGGIKPLRELSAPSKAFDPRGCAVDPIGGDLAITALDGPVLVYPHAKEPAREYGADWAWDQDCAYTNKGVLFVDGTVGYDSSDFVAAAWHLTRNKQLLQRLHFRDSIDFANSGGLRWDGRYIAWGDEYHPTIYRIAPSEGLWSVVGETKLKLNASFGEFWIHGNTLIAPYSLGSTSKAGAVGFFHYPRGGASFATIAGFENPVDVTYSRAP